MSGVKLLRTHRGEREGGDARRAPEVVPVRGGELPVMVGVIEYVKIPCFGGHGTCQNTVFWGPWN